MRKGKEAGEIEGFEEPGHTVRQDCYMLGEDQEVRCAYTGCIIFSWMRCGSER